MSSLFSYDDFDTPRIGYEKEVYRQSPNAVKDATKNVGNVIRGLTDLQTKKGTITGGLRAANSDATQSRMALPISDVAKSGVQSLATTGKFSQSTKPELSKPELSDLDRLKGAYDIDYKYRGLYGNQDIDLTKRKIREVDTLANNETNRAYGMQLATQFPYQKYANESASARSIMDNSQAAIPTFLNRATASRLNPVSMSL